MPNLYWALTNLPHPLVPLNKGIGGERDIFLGWFRDLDDSAPMSEDQLKRFITPLDVALAGRKPIKPGDVRTWLEMRTKDEGEVRAARRRLVEYGLPEERLLRFPADQVILLDEKREYEVHRDDVLKLMNLPMRQAISLAAQIEPSKERALFADPMVEGLLSINRPQARLDQRNRPAPARRSLGMYAGEHDAHFPRSYPSLSVPLPDDPFTGGPFRYEVNGGTASLRGSPPPGEEKNPVYNVHYEVTLRR